MLVHLLVLNYNGRRRLAECMPSVLRAAENSSHDCEVAVIDNQSTDDSVAWLGEHFPRVRVIHRPNRGLCSFNDVVPSLSGPVALLLNNDVKLAPGCIDPLVAPLLARRRGGATRYFMTAPLCWRFDGSTYEGFRTAVGWRWGLVQATALFPGHEAATGRPGLTASAGAALAVDRRKFAELGGFDPLYLPGRLEDLDFALRGYLAGYRARYVPQSVMYHRGMATFGEVFGSRRCDQLALRNSLLFQWKNLRHPLHLARQVVGLPLRVAVDVARAPWVGAERRWSFVRALFAALGRLGELRATRHRTWSKAAVEREFFRRFHPRRMARMPVQQRKTLNELPTVAGTQRVVVVRPRDVVPRLSAATDALEYSSSEITEGGGRGGLPAPVHEADHLQGRTSRPWHPAHPFGAGLSQQGSGDASEPSAPSDCAARL